jgi:nitroimidazol reductase NimA-like FMN-containing flavoprotein (pyridoxamine 5'-phosphate oxidase superfamily)
MPKQWITDRAEMEAILGQCLVGSLATVSPDGSPYVVAVNYVYHDGKIYFHGALEGKKIDNIAHEPRVCFEAHVMDRILRAPRAIEFGTRYRSVVVHGRARLLDELAAKRKALMVLTARYAGNCPFEPPTDKEVAATAVVEIGVGEMTGKRNADP